MAPLILNKAEKKLVIEALRLSYTYKVRASKKLDDLLPRVSVQLKSQAVAVKEIIDKLELANERNHTDQNLDPQRISESHR